LHFVAEIPGRAGGGVAVHGVLRVATAVLRMTGLWGECDRAAVVQPLLRRYSRRP
jgi:hypothetical protein